MRIRFYGPFNERIGKDLVEFRIEDQISLIDFAEKLAGHFPSLREYSTGGEKLSMLNSIFFVARRGQLLGPNDSLRDEDEIEILPPTTGG